MKTKKLPLLLILVLLPILSILGCGSKPYRDITNSISSQVLPVPEGEYKSVVWLDDDRIAFIYRPQLLRGNDLGIDFRIGVFDITSSRTADLALPPLPPNCSPKPSGITELARLPNGTLGFIFFCHGRGLSGTMYIWNNSRNSFTEWQSLPNFLPRSFSFSPDMSQFIQENGKGDGLNNELYLVDSNKTIKKILSDFQRATSPAWSRDGTTIAFAGTKEYPDNTDITTWDDIEWRLHYPWDIYVMDANVSNVRILSPQLGNIYDLKWSPTNSNFLLFGGTAFDDKDGVWLLDISYGNIKRLWTENTRFDWSTDGSKIVLLDNGLDGWWRSISIINLPFY